VSSRTCPASLRRAALLVEAMNIFAIAF